VTATTGPDHDLAHAVRRVDGAVGVTWLIALVVVVVTVEDQVDLGLNRASTKGATFLSPWYSRSPTEAGASRPAGSLPGGHTGRHAARSAAARRGRNEPRCRSWHWAPPRARSPGRSCTCRPRACRQRCRSRRSSRPPRCRVLMVAGRGPRDGLEPAPGGSYEAWKPPGCLGAWVPGCLGATVALVVAECGHGVRVQRERQVGGGLLLTGS
jgi:hypothetical protein